MSKLLTYLKYEGVRATIEKVFLSLKSRESTTIFLRCETPNELPNIPQIQIAPLTQERLADFEKIKFFDHIDGKAYINSPNSLILAAMRDGEVIGYVGAEFAKNKAIHGLGCFQLEAQEAWIGPTYVKKQARGQGISTCLIAEMLCVLRNEKGIQTFFTAINSRNASSIRSFEKNGFKLIGHVRAIEKVLTSDFDTEFNGRFKKNKKKVEA